MCISENQKLNCYYHYYYYCSSNITIYNKTCRSKNNISDNISANLFALPLETSVCEVIGGDGESKGEVQGKHDGKDETCHSHGGVTPKNEGEHGGTGVAHVTVETNQLCTLVFHRITTSHVGVICLLVLAYSIHLLSRTLNW